MINCIKKFCRINYKSWDNTKLRKASGERTYLLLSSRGMPSIGKAISLKIFEDKSTNLCRSSKRRLKDAMIRSRGASLESTSSSPTKSLLTQVVQSIMTFLSYQSMPGKKDLAQRRRETDADGQVALLNNPSVSSYKRSTQGRSTTYDRKVDEEREEWQKRRRKQTAWKSASE